MTIMHMWLWETFLWLSWLSSTHWMSLMSYEYLVYFTQTCNMSTLSSFLLCWYAWFRNPNPDNYPKLAFATATAAICWTSFTCLLWLCQWSINSYRNKSSETVNAHFRHGIFMKLLLNIGCGFVLMKQPHLSDSVQPGRSRWKSHHTFLTNV